MAIRIITGVPGSGKSFYAVKHLRDNYFEYDKKQDHWTAKKGVTVITNIDELKLKHLNLDEILSDNNLTIKGFFNVDYQEKIKKKYPKVVYFLDECQKYFPRKFYDEKVFYYFQYHRHMGHDVYLMTQSIRLLPREIEELAEFEIRAVRRGLSVFGELKYKVMANGEIIDHKVLKKNKGIFNLYRSMDQKEVEKIKNPLIKYMVVTLIIALIGIWAFKKTFFGGALDEKKITEPRTHQGIEKKKSLGKKSPVRNSHSVGDNGGFVPVEINYCKIGNRIEIVDYYTETLIPLHWATYDVFSHRVGKNLKIWAMIPKDRIKKKKVQPEETTPKKPTHEPIIQEG